MKKVAYCIQAGCVIAGAIALTAIFFAAWEGRFFLVLMDSALFIGVGTLFVINGKIRKKLP